jgi:hypothetical protein
MDGHAEMVTGSGCVLIQVRVEPRCKAIEPRLDCIESHVDPGEPRFNAREPRIDPGEPCVDPREPSVHPRIQASSQGIHPRAEVEQRPERGSGEESDRGPDGGIHLVRERSTEV